MWLATRSRLVWITAIVAISAFSSADAFAQASTLRCDFYKQFGCMAQRCNDVSTPAWSIIDFNMKLYSICDKAGCQRFDFVQWPDGIYVGLAFPGKELMAKINLTDNSIIETSTYLSTSITSFGNCAADPSPR